VWLKTLISNILLQCFAGSNTTPDTYREQQEFLDILRKTPYLEVRLGSTKLAQGIPIEKGIDIMLATDLLYCAWHNFYDVAILVSGDADFAYAVQAIKNMGKHVEVAYFESGVSKDLLNVADYLHLLDRSFFRDLWAGKRRVRRRRVERSKSKTTPSSEQVPPSPPPLL
jgi:uncharacterized LabA/DUF88 family protein